MTFTSLLLLLSLINRPLVSAPDFTAIIGADHPFHVSKCQIEYRQETESIQITLHLFLDDLEEALKRHGSGNLYLFTEKESPAADNRIREYLLQQFQIKVDQERQSLEWVGKEQTKDLVGVWCYLEIQSVKQVNSLTVRNVVLTELFEDQQNIIMISMPQKKAGYLILHKNHPEETVNF